MTREERIAKIRAGCWIRYDRAETLWAKLDELRTLPKTHRMPNLLIVGETNNGKTALMRQFTQRHLPQAEKNNDVACVPVVAIQAPPGPDERRFYQAILRQLFAPFRPSHSAGQLQHEVLRLLSTIRTKMLIIDEIHHILAGPLLRQRNFLNVIKYLGNELQIPIVAIGTADAFHAIQTDVQLANRFEPAILPRWEMDAEYLRLLASFEVAFQLQYPSELTNPSLAAKILRVSGGAIGEIEALLRTSAVEAVRSGSERITGELLDHCGYVSPEKRRETASSI